MMIANNTITQEQTQYNMINRSNNQHKIVIEDNKMKNWSNNKTMKKNNSHKMNHRIQLFPLPKSLFTISEDVFSPSTYYSDDDYSSVDTERRRRKNSSRSSSSSSNITCPKTHTAIVTAALENLSILDDDDDENEDDDDDDEEKAEERQYLALSSRWNAEDSTLYNSRNRSKSRNSSSSLPVLSSSSLASSQSQSVATVLFVSPDRPPKRPIRRRDTDTDRTTATLLTVVCSISLL